MYCQRSPNFFTTSLSRRVRQVLLVTLLPTPRPSTCTQRVLIRHKVAQFGTSERSINIGSPLNRFSPRESIRWSRSIRCPTSEPAQIQRMLCLGSLAQAQHRKWAVRCARFPHTTHARHSAWPLAPDEYVR